ncbi:hypothetical protein LTR94_029124, partial [Friedmanniomyces endolithicus]
MSMILSVVALVLLAAFGVAELDAAAIEADRWAEVGPAWKLTALSVLTLGLGFAVIALAARLSLFVPATLAKARMISLNAIALSRGAFAPLVIGLILTGVPKLVLLVLSGLGLLSGQGAWFVWVAVIALVEAPLTLSFLGWAYPMATPVRVIRRHPLAVYLWGLAITGFSVLSVVLTFAFLSDLPLAAGASADPETLNKMMAFNGLSMLLNV